MPAALLAGCIEARFGMMAFELQEEMEDDVRIYAHLGGEQGSH